VKDELSTIENVLTSCELCNGQVKFKSYAFVAPWIADSRIRMTSRLMTCAECDFDFFSRTFSESELTRMYSDYRSPAYQRMRQRYEPWYTMRRNLEIGQDGVVVDERRTRLEMFLHNQLGTDKVGSIKSVLDIGGDEGQFIPKLPQLETMVVLEVSQAPVRQGIQRIASLSEAQGKGFDLVMICHTLEHVQNPLQFMRDILADLDDWNYLYVEVPIDGYEMRGRWFNSRGQRLLRDLIIRVPVLGIIVDLYVQIVRRLGIRLMFPAVVKQSEHVNYFSRVAVEQLATQLNLRVFGAFLNATSESISAPFNKSLGAILIRK